MCENKYWHWRAPYFPEKVRTVFIGLAPPIPKSWTNRSVRYVYKNVESPLASTSLRLRNALALAFDLRPELSAQYPSFASYLETTKGLTRKPFLEALKGSSMVWVDTIEFPVSTKDVYNLLGNDLFLSNVAERLSQLECDRAIFLSSRHKKLSRAFEDEMIEKGCPPAITVFPRNLWTTTESAAASILADALAKRPKVPRLTGRR
jgi:hypothetical protein